MSDRAPVLERIYEQTHGNPPDRACLPGSDEKWEGYLLGVEEAGRAAEAIMSPMTDDDLKPGDLQRGFSMLNDAAERGETWARAVLAELDRLNRDRALIRRGAISVGGDHYWTGRNWKER